MAQGDGHPPGSRPSPATAEHRWPGEPATREPDRRALVVARVVVGRLRRGVRGRRAGPGVDRLADRRRGHRPGHGPVPLGPPRPAHHARAPAAAPAAGHRAGPGRPTRSCPRGRPGATGPGSTRPTPCCAANDQAGRLRRVVFLGRLVPLLEALACGLVMFLLGRRLVGEEAGLLAAGLWFSTPFVLGFGHVQSIDVAFTLATLVVALDPRPPRRGADAWAGPRRSGAALAAALATRQTALVLIPVALVAVGRGGPGASGAPWSARSVVTALVAYAGLWLLYRGFDLDLPGRGAGGPLRRHHRHRRPATPWWPGWSSPSPPPRSGGPASGTSPSPPTPVRPGCSARPGRAPAGGSSRAAWWPRCPLPALAVLVLGPLAWWRVDRPSGAAGPSSPSRCPGPCCSLFTAAQPLALGLRLALPSLALWMVLAGAGGGPAAAGPVRGGPCWARWRCCRRSPCSAASSHALAWMPPPFRPAYRFVSDSNVDFGQDLWRVRDWSEGREPWVAVISPRGVWRSGGDTRPLVGADPSEVTGWVAVGVTALTVVERRRAGVAAEVLPGGDPRGREHPALPLRDPAVRRPRPGPPGRPLRRCAGQPSGLRASPGRSPRRPASGIAHAGAAEVGPDGVDPHHHQEAELHGDDADQRVPRPAHQGDDPDDEGTDRAGHADQLLARATTCRSRRRGTRAAASRCRSLAARRPGRRCAGRAPTPRPRRRGRPTPGRRAGSGSPGSTRASTRKIGSLASTARPPTATAHPYRLREAR